MGDLLFSLPALNSLRSRYPDAHISSVARPSCCDLLRLSGLVDEVIERPKGLRSDTRLGGVLRERRFDLAILFSTSCGARLLAELARADETVGFTDSLWGLGFSKAVEWTSPPSTANDLRLVEAIGCGVTQRDYVGLIKIGPAEAESAARLLRPSGIEDGDRYIALAPGTSDRRGIKSWADEGFARVADYAAAEFGLRSVVVGTSGGAHIAELSRYATDLTGKTSVSLLASVLHRAEVFVGVDSGAMHLAATTGTRVVGLFGPTDFLVTGPQGVGHQIVSMGMDCAPCLRSQCKKGAPCMLGIRAEDVLGRIRESLGTPRN